MYFNVKREQVYKNYRHYWKTTYSISKEPEFKESNGNVSGSNSFPCKIIDGVLLAKIFRNTFSLYKMREENQFQYLCKQRGCETAEEAYRAYKGYMLEVEMMDWSK